MPVSNTSKLSATFLDQNKLSGDNSDDNLKKDKILDPSTQESWEEEDTFTCVCILPITSIRRRSWLGANNNPELNSIDTETLQQIFRYVARYKNAANYSVWDMTCIVKINVYLYS